MKAGKGVSLNLALQELGLDVGGWFGGRNYLGATADVALVEDFGTYTRSPNISSRLRGGVEARRVIATGTGWACVDDDCHEVTTRSWLGLAAGIEDQYLGRAYGGWLELSLGYEWVASPRFHTSLTVYTGAGMDSAPTVPGTSAFHGTAGFRIYMGGNGG